MAKRTASSDLNHENWDREEDPEDAGRFTKASDEDLKRRVIKVAKRRNPIASHSEEGKPSAFEGFSGFSKAPAPTTNAFKFLSNVSGNEPLKTNGVGEKSSKLDEYYAKLKGLNESVLEWITQHVKSNPLINLQPVFKDYDKYYAQLETIKTDAESNSAVVVPTFTFGASTSSSPGFSFTSTASTASTISNFPFGQTTSGVSSAGKFSFTSTVVKQADEPSKDEDSEEEPPTVVFKKITEEGHIYSIRCKVFVKKGESYGDRGVGTLFLKPVPDSAKVQLIVRAENNLGNLICNFILSGGIPLKRMGKKDVMLVCLPTPDTKPPPVPILLRVKTSEDADQLLKTLEKHKK